LPQRAVTKLTSGAWVGILLSRRWWHRDLHNHVSARLERALIPLRRVAVTTVPFQLDD